MKKEIEIGLDLFDTGELIDELLGRNVTFEHSKFYELCEKMPTQVLLDELDSRDLSVDEMKEFKRTMLEIFFPRGAGDKPIQFDTLYDKIKFDAFLNGMNNKTVEEIEKFFK